MNATEKGIPGAIKMGCIICNILRDPSYVVEDADDEKQAIHTNELKEEMCNDIAVGHPEMVTRINEIYKARAGLMIN